MKEGRQPDRWTDRQAVRQEGRETERQAGRQVCRNTGSQAGRLWGNICCGLVIPINSV